MDCFDAMFSLFLRRLRLLLFLHADKHMHACNLTWPDLFITFVFLLICFVLFCHLFCWFSMLLSNDRHPSCVREWPPLSFLVSLAFAIHLIRKQWSCARLSYVIIVCVRAQSIKKGIQCKTKPKINKTKSADKSASYKCLSHQTRRLSKWVFHHFTLFTATRYEQMKWNEKKNILWTFRNGICFLEFDFWTCIEKDLCI